jgi:hypothetical protein
MTAVIALLDAPEADSPLNVDAGEYEAGTKKRYDG